MKPIDRPLGYGMTDLISSTVDKIVLPDIVSFIRLTSRWCVFFQSLWDAQYYTGGNQAMKICITSGQWVMLWRDRTPNFSWFVLFKLISYTQQKKKRNRNCNRLHFAISKYGCCNQPNQLIITWLTRNNHLKAHYQQNLQQYWPQQPPVACTPQVLWLWGRAHYFAIKHGHFLKNRAPWWLPTSFL